MNLSDFDFDLPDSLIATRPARPRTSARLLLARGDDIRDQRVSDLPDHLRPGDTLVLNVTKVIPARLNGVRHRRTAEGEARARIEITLLEPAGDGSWTALPKPLRKIKAGDVIVFSEGLSAEVAGVGDGRAALRFDAEGDALEAALERDGDMPLPPYIARRRPPDAADRADYQSVFARERGAVAAPTASLHFDGELLSRLRARGVEFVEVTLHVGAGTFLPVRVEDVSKHRMHAEWGEITEDAAEALTRAKAEGRRVIPVGTTALRLIESAAAAPSVVGAFRGATDIFIRPGFEFRVADGLMTNFHLPKSTLMMLVSALMGAERVRRIYGHAIARGYRFFSYGDSSLLFPDEPGA